MAHMNELQEESRRLEKISVEERLKAEIIQEAGQKRGEVISA
jgi:putative transposase